MRSRIESSRKQKTLGAFFIAVALIGAGFAAEKYFIQEQAQQVNEEAPGAVEDTKQNTAPSNRENNTSRNSIEVYKSGSFQGKAGHAVSGRVKIVSIDGEKYLRFEDYQQTQGPDVFLYLTPSEDPGSSQEIDAGRKIRIDGGPDGGEITKEGNFNQKLPSDIEISKYNGVGVWCDAFSVPFGSASF